MAGAARQAIIFALPDGFCSSMDAELGMKGGFVDGNFYLSLNVGGDKAEVLCQVIG